MRGKWREPRPRHPPGAPVRATQDSLTDVPGLAVGHAEVPGGGSGCTVVLGPMRARADLRGLATGARELGTVREGHVTTRVDALLLSGGSAFGLAAADGVLRWLEERRRGHETSVTEVPIVPGAVLFDLASGRARPGPDEGRRACEAATSDPVRQGRVGAGAGATVGKLLGPEHAIPAGVGSSSARVARWTVGALAVTNALGDVVDRDGRVVGVGGSRGEREEGTRALLEAARKPGFGAGSELRAGEHTTLAVVATDAPLTGGDLVRMARVASTGVARRISPVHTPFDGDILFAVSTAKEGSPLSTRYALALGVTGREALETAILRSVDPRER